MFVFVFHYWFSYFIIAYRISLVIFVFYYCWFLYFIVDFCISLLIFVFHYWFSYFIIVDFIILLLILVFSFDFRILLLMTDVRILLLIFVFYYWFSYTILEQVVDMPSKFDSRDVLFKEIGRCMFITSPGPHVVLYIIRFVDFLKIKLFYFILF